MRLSVIVPVGERHDEIVALYGEYKAAISATGLPYEFLFVLDGIRPKAAAALELLAQRGERFFVVALSRLFGEATAVMAALEHATGDIILTLPAHSQVEAADIGKLVGALDTVDLAFGRRWPRVGGWFERLRRGVFHGLLGMVTRLEFNDLGCGARAMKRTVLEEIHPYGEQLRFLPVLADRQGFRIREIDVRQSPQDRFDGVYRPRAYTRGFLDIFTIFFLTRFTKKPLRFFGMAGVSTFGLGALLILILVIQRLFFGQALADRPALLLSSLLVVLGLQVFALGLLGELMIFTHARNMKDYQVEKVIQFRADTSAPVASQELQQTQSG